MTNLIVPQELDQIFKLFCNASFWRNTEESFLKFCLYHSLIVGIWSFTLLELSLGQIGQDSWCAMGFLVVPAHPHKQGESSMA